MKFSIYSLVLGLLVVSCIHLSKGSERQHTTVLKVISNEDSPHFQQKSEFDFLDKRYKAIFWSNLLREADKEIKIISGQISDPETGFTRISFYPKNTAASKIIDSLYIANKKDLVSFDQFELPDVARKLQGNKNFNIWAFYTDKKSVIKESDLHQVVYLPNFPCKVFLYKKDNRSWILRNTLTINSWTEYSKLFSSEILAN